MPVKRSGQRLMQVVAAATIAGLVVTGCAKARPTTKLIVLTPPPATRTPAPVVTEVAVEVTPTPKTSPTLTEPTAPPVSTAVPSTACTGSASNQAFWAEAANNMKFDVYCPVLPTGWFVSTGSWEGASGGKVNMSMHGPGGATLQIDEGGFCTSDAATCSPHEVSLGQATFGDLIGSLASSSGGTYFLYVNPGTAKGYTLTSTGMSQEKFVAYAAAFVKVATS